MSEVKGSPEWWEKKWRHQLESGRELFSPLNPEMEKGLLKFDKEDLIELINMLFQNKLEEIEKFINVYKDKFDE